MRDVEKPWLELPRKKRPLAERLWEKVAVGDPNSCWLWRGTRNSHGYGQIRDDSRRWLRAHRVAWTLTRGPIPAGLHVCHHCDVPLCCNPDHLFLGTHQDNMSDCVQKGRHSSPPLCPGTSHGAAKLTEANIVEIRRVYAGGGVTQRELANLYGVTQGNIHLVVSGKHWKHV